jgi:hypothetical protein
MKKLKKKPNFSFVAWRVSEEELTMIKVVKHELVRKSTSDVLRFLVQKEYEKILKSNNPVGVR